MRIGGAALGQRTDLNRVHGYECGLNERGFDELVKGLVQCVAPCMGNTVHIHADALCQHHTGIRIAFDSHKVCSGNVLDRVSHGNSLPRRSKIDLMTKPLNLIGSEYLLGSAGQNALENVHHSVKIRVCLIQLTCGKLRVVLGVHALVAENTADFVHALNSADNKPLKVQLRRNAHIHVYVKGIMMCNKRTCIRTTCDGAKNRCLDLHKAQAVKVSAQIRDEFTAYLKITSALGVHYQIDIAHTIAQLFVGHAVELFGQRTQALGKQHDRLDMHGNFLGLGLENEARNADYIADIVLAEVCKLLFGHCVLADVQLNRAAVILDVAEYCLAHAAL